MEHGTRVFTFEFPSHQPRLLPFAEPPAPKSKDGPPKDVFTLENAEIQEVFQPPVIPVEDVEPIIEPLTGLEPEWFDKQSYDLARHSKKYPPRIPHLLKRDVPPLRPPEAIKPEEKLVGPDQLYSLSGIVPSNVTYLCVADVALPKKKLKALPKALAQFANLEILLLRGLGLSTLSGCKFPNLRFLDLSHNSFSKVANIVNCIKHSPNLDMINILYNPCAYREDVIGRLLAVCLYLGVVNEKELSLAERIHALETHGPKAMRNELHWLRWDMALDLIPEISQMRFTQKGWDPQVIVAISLPNCGLTNISVATMVNLQTLDLSNNKIDDLRNTGIEQCNNLARINLKHNLISKINRCVPTLAQVCALLTIYMEGNPVVLKKTFRASLIFQTRNLRGTNRVPGLLEIEGAPVSLEERVAAMDMFWNHSDERTNPQIFRWNMNLVSKYGHAQIRAYLHKIKSCAFPGKNLTYVSLQGFFMLQHLDLSNNNLTDIVHLEQLELLIIVDLSNNPRLSTNKTLKQLAQCTRLESFSFLVVSVPDHKRAPTHKSYRETVLRSILFANRGLKVVDNMPIKHEERVETYSGIGGTPEEVEIYRFHLALTLNCCSSVTSGGQSVQYHYSEVGIGAQYDPAAITGLRRLSKWGLVSRVCNFSAFVNLVELNLSFNNLTEIDGLGLEGHRHLRVLCATNNSIATPHARIAAFLDSVPNLEVVCLRENPCMRNADDRMKLLGILRLQRVFAPVLHTLDTPITLGERVEAWKRAEPSETTDNDTERLCYSVVLHMFFLRQPDPQIPHNLLTVLDLGYSELGFVDVGEFENLRELILVGNRLESLERTNIDKLQLLVVLDLRYNLLPRLEAIAAVVAQLPALETLGILGNKCAQTAGAGAAMLSTLSLRDVRSFRVRFLALLPDTVRVRGHSLEVLDSKEITIEERAQACKSDGFVELLSTSLPNLHDYSTERRSTLAGFELKAKNLMNQTLRKGSVVSTSQQNCFDPTGSTSQQNIFDPKVMCWPMALLRRIPANLPYAAVTEADFSNCFLSVLDLSVLPSLVKLSLANNNIREQNLERSNITSLNDLRMLDLRSNQLKTLGHACEVLGRIPRLENLWLEGNPCFQNNSPSTRVRFFKKMRRGDLLLNTLNGTPVMPPDLVKLGLSKRRASDMM